MEGGRGDIEGKNKKETIEIWRPFLTSLFFEHEPSSPPPLQPQPSCLLHDGFLPFSSALHSSACPPSFLQMMMTMIRTSYSLLWLFFFEPSLTLYCNHFQCLVLLRTAFFQFILSYSLCLTFSSEHISFPISSTTHGPAPLSQRLWLHLKGSKPINQYMELYWRFFFTLNRMIHEVSFQITKGFLIQPGRRKERFPDDYPELRVRVEVWSFDSRNVQFSTLLFTSQQICIWSMKICWTAEVIDVVSLTKACPFIGIWSVITC